jgi:GTP-eEF1A C-terminal domain-like
VTKSAEAALVWMDQRPLELHRRYLLKHTSQTVPVFLSSIGHRIDLRTLKHEPASTLRMNDMGAVTLTLFRPIALDIYAENRSMGAFILVDADSNSTVAAGMFTAASSYAATCLPLLAGTWGPVSMDERAARWGHRGAVLALSGPMEMIEAIERSLFAVGAVTSRIVADDDAFLLHPGLLEIVTAQQVQSGLLVLLIHAQENGILFARAEARELAMDLNPANSIGNTDNLDCPDEVSRVISAVHRLLRDTGIFISSEKADL